jgi:two-component system, cell cycle sensor histidine kinase and response regulator CckA
VTILAPRCYIQESAERPIPHELATLSLSTIDRHHQGAAEQQHLRQQAQALELLDQAVMITEPDLDWPRSRIVYVNRAFTTLLGYSAAEVVGQTPRLLQRRQTDQAVLKKLRQELAARHAFRGELVYERRDGSHTIVEVSIAPLRDTAGQITDWVTTLSDLTAHKQLEAQALQAQKIASIGRLTSGVAHDFNNLLTAILGYSDLALTDLAPDQAAYHNLEHIQQAARRGASLVRQLSTFARRRAIETRALDINDLLQDLVALLWRFMDSTIEFLTVPALGLRPAWADRGQIEQVLVNLVINARDAMPAGGRLTITTRDVVLNDLYAQRHPGVKPGAYVYLAVADTGQGMDEVTKAHLFEPFFTTKGPDRGTGLGLATCYRIIAQHGGHIRVTSAPGKGTTVHIYLPAATGDVEVGQTYDGDVIERLPTGTETILLAEDEPAIRTLVARVLCTCGYTVLEARDGIAALELAQARHAQPIHLLVTDLSMPRMDGAQLAAQLAAIQPSIKVLFMSGGLDTARPKLSLPAGHSALLQKPFAPALLAQQVRALLDVGGAGADLQPR